MPDTLSREDIDGLRRLAFDGDTEWFTRKEVQGLLAHIDALTAAARRLVDTLDDAEIEWSNYPEQDQAHEELRHVIEEPHDA